MPRLKHPAVIFILQSLSKQRIFFITGCLITVAGFLLSYSNDFTKHILYVIESLLNNELNHEFWTIGFRRTGIELLIAGMCLFLFLFLFERLQKRLFICFSVIWTLLFVFYVIKDSVNVPIADDYLVFLQFLNTYSISKNPCEIFNQYGEVRVIFMHLIAVILFHSGIFNFKLLILTGNMFLIGGVLLLLKSINLENIKKQLLVFALVILIFQFEYYDASIRSTGILYLACTLCFALCSMYFLNQNTKFGLIISILFSFLSISAGSHGFLMLPIGAAILLLQKRITESIIWVIISGITALIYFNNYSLAHHEVFSYLYIKRILGCVAYSMVFLGSAMQYKSHLFLPFIVGGFIWMFFLILTFKKYYAINSIVYFLLLFIILSSCIPYLIRPQMTIDTGIQVRYGIYSIMAISCCIIVLAESTSLHKSNLFFKSVLLLSFAYHFSTNIFFYPEMIIRKEKLISLIKNIKHNKPFVTQPNIIPDDANIIITKSIENKFYQPEY